MGKKSLSPEIRMRVWARGERSKMAIFVIDQQFTLKQDPVQIVWRVFKKK